MTIRTKIICTIGPAVRSFEKIMELIATGMNVARINFSHGDYQTHESVIETLKRARKEAGVPMAIMLDTKGPEVRIGEIADGGIHLEKGDRLILTPEEIIGTTEKVTIRPGYILEQLEPGAAILFDDGYICSHFIERRPEGILVSIDDGGFLKSGKGVNFPYANLQLPALTNKDIADITFGCKHGVEIVAASFVRSAEDVLSIKSLLADLGSSDTLVIAKIENHEGVKNFDSIVQVADGIMIARGDLGVEIPLTQVPRLQKMMIKKCYLAGKPAITATQMLESMIYNPRPTRAEASDVANAIYDSTSAVMLSGETAVGKYPVETLLTMTEIVRETEKDFPYRNFFQFHSTLAYNDVPSSVTLATVKTAYSSNIKAIFVFTSSGASARLLDRLRPEMPLLAMTPKEKTYHQMSLYWGVTPVLCDPCSNVSEAFNTLSNYALKHGFVKYGDLVALTAGTPFGVSGTTNMMMVESIGDVLVRGSSGMGAKIYGKIMILHTLDGKSPYEVKDKIIVIAKCDESYISFIKKASGIILQNHIDDLESETFVMQIAREMNKSALVRADNAFNVLSEGLLVTIDPEKGLVYKGVVL